MRIMLLSTALLAVSVHAQPADRDGVWTPLPSLPIEVSNNAVTSVDNSDGTWTLYSFMGIKTPAGRGDSTVEAFRLDWPGGQWTPIADVPLLQNRAKVAASAVTVNGEVYLIGGYTTLGFTEITEKRLFRYDPDANGGAGSYAELAPVPIEVDDTVPAVYQDRYIYLISGWHGPINDNTTAVQIYDTQTDTWTQATPIPGPEDGLFGHAGGIIEHRNKDDGSATLVFVGGSVSTSGFFISDTVYTGQIDQADIAAIIWQEQPIHPGRPTYRAAGALSTTPNNKLLIVGGTDNPYNINGVGYNGIFAEPLEQAIAFDATMNAWSTHRFTGRPATMDHRNLVPLGDGYAIIGGMLKPGQMTGTCWLLTLDPCIADLSGDATIDITDFELWFEAYQQSNPAADQNGDGITDASDYTAWVARAGRGCL